ncbi:MAG: tRNA epoxyqueuosine(34) reductase QueG [bacterium]|nr:tRNA epoxyqueuosine(34) reductase QueG [bacterium]
MACIDVEWLQSIVSDYGFDGVGYCNLEIPPRTFQYFENWINHSYYGTMTYLPRGLEKRKNPCILLNHAKSWITVYKQYPIINENLCNPAYGRIAYYAQSEDYHLQLTPRLQEIANQIDCKYFSHSKVYIDTGPVLERDVLTSSGISFFGKNSCSIIPQKGSYFFIGVILSSVTIKPNNHRQTIPNVSCGRCTQCIDVCPTQAIIAPYILDARKCISYLTIEYKGNIPFEYWSKMKNWIFGCDECQICCPWNRFHTIQIEKKVLSSKFVPYLLDLVTLSEQDFKEMYDKTPILRIGRNGFLRNVAIALTNWGNELAKEGLQLLSKDSSELVREHARLGIRWLQN